MIHFTNKIVKVAKTLGASVSSEMPVQKLPQIPFDTFEIQEKVTNNLKDLMLNFAKKIENAVFVGQGEDAKVYRLNDEYVARISKKHPLIEYQKQRKQSFKLSQDEAKLFFGERFVEVEDNFEGRNFGQPVAKSENGLIQICKNVPGFKLYACGNALPSTYIAKLEQYANFSDETIEAFIQDVAYINQRGFRIDQTNPENFLYDSASKRIGIVDIDVYERDVTKIDEPFGHDWILAVLSNEHEIYNVYRKASRPDRQKIIRTVKKLEERIIPICKKYGIPISKWNSYDYGPTSIINVLEMQKIDYGCDLLGQIVYDKYPYKAKSYEKFLESIGACFKL